MGFFDKLKKSAVKGYKSSVKKLGKTASSRLGGAMLGYTGKKGTQYIGKTANRLGRAYRSSPYSSYSRKKRMEDLQKRIQEQRKKIEEQRKRSQQRSSGMQVRPGGFSTESQAKSIGDFLSEMGFGGGGGGGYGGGVSRALSQFGIDMPVPSATPESISEAVANTLPKVTKRFEDVVPNVFDESLARKAIASRVARLINPQLEKTLDAARGEMATRGLFRSGVRKEREQELSKDIAEQERDMQEQLLNVRLSEIQRQRAEEQKRFEEAMRLGMDYSAPSSLTDTSLISTGTANYTPEEVTEQPVDLVGGRYGIATNQLGGNRYAPGWQQYIKGQYSDDFLTPTGVFKLGEISDKKGGITFKNPKTRQLQIKKELKKNPKTRQLQIKEELKKRGLF